MSKQLRRVLLEKLSPHNILAGVLLTVAAPVAVVVLYLGFLIAAERTNAALRVDERGSLLAQSLGDGVLLGLISHDTVNLGFVVRNFVTAHPAIATIQIRGKDKQLLYQYAPSATAADSDEQDVKSYFFTVSVDAPPLDLAMFPESASGATARPDREIVGFVELALDRHVLTARERVQQGKTVTAALLAILIAVILGLTFAIRITRPLRQVLRALRRRRSGEQSDPIKVTAKGELGLLQQGVKEMFDSEDAKRETLNEEILRRTMDLERANTDRRRLIARLNAASEEERNSVAAELHDQLGAGCTVMLLSARQIAAATAGNTSVESTTLRRINEGARTIVAQAQETYSAARGIIQRLRPEVIDTMGLKPALLDLVNAYTGFGTSCRYSAEIDDACEALPKDVKLAIYRIVQEAFTNVTKHAHASECFLRLVVDDTRVVLAVRDDGTGIEPNASLGDGIGLIGMRERCEGLGGSLEVDSSLAGGTNIRVVLPMPASAR